MKRKRTNKQQRYEACLRLAEKHQASYPGQQDLFGNPLPEPDDKLRVFIGGAGLYKFKYVKENLVLCYFYDNNRVEYITIDDNPIDYQLDIYKQLSNRVYNLIDNEVTNHAN